MVDTSDKSVCIVGAGSAGIITGYHLALADAAVTYLVRPHGQERLSRPQVLYSYDSNTLGTFSDFQVMTDAGELDGKSFDFVFLTIDGAALQSDSGQALTDDLGRAFRDTSTGIIIAGQGIGLRQWFLERSGLSEEQVTMGGIGSFVYEAQAVTLPLHPGVRTDLLAKADYAYRHYSPAGFLIDMSSPKVARDFAALWDRNGRNTCNVVSVDDYVIPSAMICLTLSLRLLGWPAMRDVDPSSEQWRLGTDAMREMLHLSLYGDAGIAASERTDAESAWKSFRQTEEDSLPFDHVGFLHYHHGEKLYRQNVQTIREALARGQAQGLDMPALQELIDRLPK